MTRGCYVGTVQLRFFVFPGRLCHCDWDSCQGNNIIKDCGDWLLAIWRKWPVVVWQGYFTCVISAKSNRKNSNHIDICHRKQLCACIVTACPWNDSQSHREPQSCSFYQLKITIWEIDLPCLKGKTFVCMLILKCISSSLVFLSCGSWDWPICTGFSRSPCLL